MNLEEKKLRDTLKGLIQSPTMPLPSASIFQQLREQARALGLNYEVLLADVMSEIRHEERKARSL